jgi:hypothetical protein
LGFNEFVWDLVTIHVAGCDTEILCVEEMVRDEGIDEDMECGS